MIPHYTKSDLKRVHERIMDHLIEQYHLTDQKEIAETREMTSRLTQNLHDWVHYVYRHVKGDIAQFHAVIGKEFDKHIQTHVERFETSKSITCSKGCYHCCYMHVGISTLEAKGLAKIVRFTEEEINHLEQQLGYDNKNWYKIPFEFRSCVFLKQGQCQIYEYRPMACRLMFSMSDPKLCDGAKYVKDTKILMWRPLWLFAFKLFLESISDHEPLPKQLLKEIKK